MIGVDFTHTPGIDADPKRNGDVWVRGRKLGQTVIGRIGFGDDGFTLGAETRFRFGKSQSPKKNKNVKRRKQKR